MELNVDSTWNLRGFHNPDSRIGINLNKKGPNFGSQIKCKVGYMNCASPFYYNMSQIYHRICCTSSDLSLLLQSLSSYAYLLNSVGH